MARNRVKAASTIKSEFDSSNIRELAKEWAWGGKGNIPIGNMQDSAKYEAAYDNAEDAFMHELTSGTLDKQYFDQIPETYLKKIGLTRTLLKSRQIENTNKEKQKSAESRKVNKKLIGDFKPTPTPGYTPRSDDDDQTVSNLPIEEPIVTPEHKESKFGNFGPMFKRSSTNMMASVLGSNPITSPIGDMINLHNEELDAAEKQKQKDEEKANGPAPRRTGGGIGSNINSATATAQVSTDSTNKLEPLLTGVRDDIQKQLPELQQIVEQVKIIAAKSEAPLEKTIEKTAEVKARVGGEKLTLAEKRERSAKFTREITQLGADRGDEDAVAKVNKTSLTDGALSETPVSNIGKNFRKLAKGAGSALLAAKEKTAPVIKSLATGAQTAVKAGAEMIKTGATSAKDKISGLFQHEPEKSAESVVEGGIEESKDDAVLKSIDTNTKLTNELITKLTTTVGATASAAQSNSSQSEPTSAPSGIGSALEMASDIKDMMPDKAEKASKPAGKGKAASKLGKFAKIGGKMLGAAGAVYSVGNGINDLMDGKEQKEMPTGLDMIDPMKWGMYGGAKIREASGGGTGGFLDNATDWVGDKLTGNKISKWSQDDVTPKHAPVTGVKKNSVVPAEIDAAASKKEQIESVAAKKANSSAGNSTVNNNVTNNETVTQMTSRSYPRNQDSTWNKVMEGRY
jgi:hypothetical protein